MVASAVSPKGLDFLYGLTKERYVTSIILVGEPEEFMQVIPPGMEVAFNRTDGNLVKLSSVHPLQ